MKTRIDVPIECVEIAKEKGAKYDGRMKSFYVPENLKISDFNEFIPLTIELVPASNWENNVRSVCKDKWDDIRSLIYRHSNYRCEICGGVGKEHPVEAHEEWTYDTKNKIQKLKNILALDKLCHQSKHIGLAMINGNGEVIKKHIMKINKWKKEDVDKYICEAFNIFDERSKINWTLDLSILDNIELY
ncbi:MAG: hypothetical protein K0R54_600 [Clostridiaceae bacterium]|jgi:hypothetical protein|nr:hypothetical protein [Clostridiaceae bacterium]